MTPDLSPADGVTTRVLVTGHRGMIGAEVCRQLTAAGFEVVGLDIADSDDLTDEPTVVGLIAGCAFLVHAAALDDQPGEDSQPGEESQPANPLLPPSAGNQAQVMRTNVGGTGILLAAAARAGVTRVVFLSSVDVLGCFMGQGAPRYLPIDDDHEVDPHGPYAWSKLVGEELCAAFTAATGMPSVCLRAPGVINESNETFIRQARESSPEWEWDPYWEFGAFIDLRDLAAATVAALTVAGLEGHHRLLINADDISSATETGAALAGRLLPEVPFRTDSRLDADPFAALVDSSGVRRLLDWAPRYRWRPQGSAR